MATKEWIHRNQELVKKYRRDWYYRNREQSKKAATDRMMEIRQWFRAYKRNCACIICGEVHPACLQFHHRDANDKEIEVAMTIKYGWGKEQILAEIAKCDVLCANCHAKLHWAELYEEMP